MLCIGMVKQMPSLALMNEERWKQYRFSLLWPKFLQRNTLPQSLRFFDQYTSSQKAHEIARSASFQAMPLQQKDQRHQNVPCPKYVSSKTRKQKQVMLF